MCPNIDYLIITLVIGNETHVIVVDYLLNFFVPLLYQRLLLFRNDDITQIERQTAFEGHLITEVLDSVEEVGGLGNTTHLDYVADDVTERFLGDNRIDVSRFCRNNFIDNHTTYGSIMHHLVYNETVLVNILDHNAYRSMNIHSAFIVGDKCFLGTVKHQSFPLSTLTQLGNVVQTKNHILCRHSDRSTVSRVQYIV